MHMPVLPDILNCRHRLLQVHRSGQSVRTSSYVAVLLYRLVLEKIARFTTPQYI